jgi:hypothetical protein
MLELKHARETSLSQLVSESDYTYIFDKNVRAAEYAFYLQVYSLYEEMVSTVPTDEKNIINYLQIDHITFAYSKNRKLIDDMIMYAYNIYGNLPLYRQKHKISGKVVHAVLTDMRMHIPPATTN